MAFIDMVEWQPSSNDVYAWKYPENNLSTGTQLVVRESQEAVLFSKGQIIGKFGAGKHTLNTENIPLLRNLFGIPFGGKNPFTAEVWFVNKASPLNIDWQTTQIRITDAESGQMVLVCANGRYGLKVKDAERFLVKLVGTMTEFTTQELTDHFQGLLESKTKSLISSYMINNRVGISQISGSLDNLSNFLNEPLKAFWEDYGMDMPGFYITSVDLDTSTEEGRKIAQAFADRSAQNIAGYTWQQKQAFGMANSAVNNGTNLSSIGAAMMTGGLTGNGGMGAAMMQTPNAFNGMNGMNGFAGGFNGNGMQNVTGGMNGNGMQNVREVFCSNCAKKYPSTSKFCPFCGDAYNPCPVCGADNSSNAKRCTTCGAALSSAASGGDVCPRCGTPQAPGVKFCSNCGAKL